MSEQPPPFQVPPQPQARRTNRTLWIIAACVLIPCCGLVIGGGFYIFRLFNEAIPFVGCLGAADALGESLNQYAAEHNGKLPKADTWQDELKPYYATTRTGDLEDIIRMQPDGLWGCWGEDGKPITGFAFNRALSQKAVKDITDLQQNPVIFEVTQPKKNNNLPYALRDSKDSPKIILGERRGWLEIDAQGATYLLMRNRQGSYRRVPVDMNSKRGNFDMGDEEGFEAKDPSTFEPSK